MTVDINIETVCNICGKAVEVAYVQYSLIITPCEDCMEDKHGEGYDLGYDVGMSDADIV